jgi:tRNA dimethylallyltransferase
VSTKPLSTVIRVLTGCTASGKTEWALRYAHEIGAEIISADSQLFYRGMNIGTAKPTADELNLVKHHLINIMEVSETMNIARYVDLAKEIVAAIHKRGNTVLVVGGSGFYLKAFFNAVADEIEISSELRSDIDSQLNREGLGSLVKRLKHLNPFGLGELDIQNPRRVTRALERCLASGKTLIELSQEFDKIPAPFCDYTLELTELEQPPEVLEKRIEKRVELMFNAGLIDEVRALLSSGLRKNLTASKAIGYREVIDYLDGKLPRDRLAYEIISNTKYLVKKQKTWFKTQLPEHRRIAADTLKNPRDLFKA